MADGLNRWFIPTRDGLKCLSPGGEYRTHTGTFTQGSIHVPFPVLEFRSGGRRAGSPGEGWEQQVFTGMAVKWALRLPRAVNVNQVHFVSCQLCLGGHDAGQTSHFEPCCQ